MVNICTFSGYVGGQPVSKKVNDFEVCEFSLSVYVGKGKDSLWLSCSVWGKRSHTAQNYLRKGDKITVSGKIGLSEYNGKSKLTLMINDFDLPVVPKKEDSVPQENKKDVVHDHSFDDEIPF